MVNNMTTINSREILSTKQLTTIFHHLNFYLKVNGLVLFNFDFIKGVEKS